VIVINNIAHRVNQILEINNLSGQVKFLGEGAWHYAYLIEKGEEQLVIRVPKETAYGRSVEFNEKELLGEYGGQKAFYSHANSVQSGVAPKTFSYHVSRELTYTIESYVGERVDLHKLKEKEAYEFGYQYGHLFNKMNEAKHNLSGFGYLKWNDEKEEVEGSFQADITKFMQEENEEILADLSILFDSKYPCNYHLIEQQLKYCLEDRTISEGNISFTNQDTSPENIMIKNNQIRLIDPFPILYYGHAFAGNLLNNYESLFIALYNSPRYAKHQFDKVHSKLKAIADGFIDSYTHQDQEIKERVRQEQYIQLVNSTVDHLNLAQNALPLEKEMRYGTKQQIEKRIPEFIKQLEKFSI
jgi:hypothetical protein